MSIDTPPAILTNPLSRRQRYAVLAAVFLGWMFGGVEMSLMVPTTRPAIQALLTSRAAGAMEVMADQWLSWFIAAFLLGAAAGGALFGSLGDRAGRVKAMAASIVCYSLLTGLGYFATSPEQLLVLRFFACLGIGGMWPAGVALVSEALPGVSRPMAAGFIGAAANVGFLLLGLVMLYHPITKESWRWVLLLGAAPVVLGCAVWAWLPESPQWLAQRKHPSVHAPVAMPIAQVFRRPLLQQTLIGILLGTIPLLGGWASGQRLVPWAGQIAEQAGLQDLKAVTQTAWASGAVLGSLAGGWIASSLGRRLSYFLMSLGSLALSLWIFLTLKPTDPQFSWAAFALGFVATMFFGWLPWFLPELFPTAVRATGIGVSYNFGRIFSAAAVLSSTVLSAWFHGDIAKMGVATSLIYAAGLVLAWFIPSDESSRSRADK